ncbi:hypothetical protein, partial [Rhodococcus koreensis]
MPAWIAVLPDAGGGGRSPDLVGGDGFDGAGSPADGPGTAVPDRVAPAGAQPVNAAGAPAAGTIRDSRGRPDTAVPHLRGVGNSSAADGGRGHSWGRRPGRVSTVVSESEGPAPPVAA